MRSLNADDAARPASCCRVGLKLREHCTWMNESLHRLAQRIDTVGYAESLINDGRDDLMVLKYGCDDHSLEFMLRSLRTLHSKWVERASDRTKLTSWVASRVERRFRVLVASVEVLSQPEGAELS